MSNSTQRQEVYQPACQDGSGGMCVTKGQCPPELRPETINANACPKDLECCFGRKKNKRNKFDLICIWIFFYFVAAQNDKSCRSRGGQCTPVARCGNAPVFREAIDCNTARGEVCCIFVF